MIQPSLIVCYTILDQLRAVIKVHIYHSTIQKITLTSAFLSSQFALTMKQGMRTMALLLQKMNAYKVTELKDKSMRTGPT